MLAVLILLFTVVPAIEIGLFVVVGGRIGPLATIAVVLFTGVAGASLARMQGLIVLRQIQEALARGTMPTDELVEGGLILFGGALLLTPGFMTDLSGILCLLPPSRRLFALGVKRWMARRVTGTGVGRAEVGGWHVWTGGVRPGEAAQEPRIDLGEAPRSARPKARGGPAIDATFSVVEEEPEDDPRDP